MAEISVFGDKNNKEQDVYVNKTGFVTVSLIRVEAEDKTMGKRLRLILVQRD